LRERLHTLHHARDREELVDVQRQLAALEHRRRELTQLAEPT
jgi:hypothetical protein